MQNALKKQDNSPREHLAVEAYTPKGSGRNGALKAMKASEKIEKKQLALQALPPLPSVRHPPLPHSHKYFIGEKQSERPWGSTRQEEGGGDDLIRVCILNCEIPQSLTSPCATAPTARLILLRQQIRGSL